MKILLVEDDTALRGALEELLAREGYRKIQNSYHFEFGGTCVQSVSHSITSRYLCLLLLGGLPVHARHSSWDLHRGRATRT